MAQESVDHHSHMLWLLVLATLFSKDLIVKQPANTPSLLKGALIGYAVATLIGVAITVGMSFSAGEATAAGGFSILAPISAIGAYIGFAQTVRRRKALNFPASFDNFFDFLLSSTGYTLVAVVLLGSSAIAVLITIVFDSIVAASLPTAFDVVSVHRSI